MQLMPWVLMSRGPTRASHAVLLDYMSDWNVICLFRSLKNKHFIVSLSVAGSFLISALTVFSTGLFSINETPISRDVELLVTQAFNTTEYEYDPWNVDSSPFALHLAVDQYNMTPPVGVVANHAFPSFHDDLSTGQAGTSNIYPDSHEYRADVDVFTMELDCEEAPVTFHNGTITASHPTEDCWFEYQLNSAEVPENPSLYALNTDIGGCNGEHSPIELPNLNVNLPDVDWRLWVLLLHEDPEGELVTSLGFEESTVRCVSKSLVCTPRYSLSRGPVRLWVDDNGSGKVLGEVEISQHTKIDPFPGVSARNILYGSLDSVATTSQGYAGDAPYMLLSSDQLDAKRFWDNTTLLAQEVEQAFTRIGAYIAKRFMLQPAEEVTSGTVTVTERRLFVRDLSFGFMLGLLIILLAIGGFLVLSYLPVAVCPKDPGSVGGLATILARSTDFMSQLEGKNSRPVSELGPLLSSGLYDTSTTEDGAFSITCRGGARRAAADQSSLPSDINWWRPFPVRIPVRTLIIGIPIALICTLEAVYQHSAKSGGIADVDESSNVRYVWVYLPALTMLSVRTLFRSLEFSARIFQPYHYLLRGGAPGDILLEDQHRKISVYGFTSALQKGHWALAAATLSVLLSSALPIAVSGLYTTSTVVQHADSTLTQTTRWTVEEYPYHDVIGAKGMVGSLILHFNLTAPQWTDTDLAFPTVALSESSGGNDDTTGVFRDYVDVRLPSLRGNLNCDEIPSERYTWSIFEGKINIELDPFEDCAFVFPNVTAWATTSGYFTNVDDSYTGDLQDMLLTPEYLACPTRIFIFGKQDSAVNVESMNLLRCRPRIEQVDLDVRLSLPSYDTDFSKPPSIVPNSDKVLFDAGFNVLGHFFDVFPNDVDMRHFLMRFDDADIDTDDQVWYRNTFLNALYALGDLGPEDLLNPIKHADALTRIHGLVVGQLLNHARAPLNESIIPNSDPPPPPSPSSFPTTRTTHRIRLVQSAVSTRIIEGVLAAMLLCAVVAITLMDTRRVLPKNPCSIAAVASLLAGSSLLREDVIPVGSEWCNDWQLKRRGVFEGRAFTMGWWESKRDGHGDEVAEKRFAIDVSNTANQV